jgi:hypothetical protein
MASTYAAVFATPPSSPAKKHAVGDATTAAEAARSGDGGSPGLAAGPALQRQMSWPPGAVRLEGWAYKGTRLSDALVVRRWLRLFAGGRLASCRSRGSAGSGDGLLGGGSGAADGTELAASPAAAETRAWQLHRGCRLEPEVWPADGDALQESDQLQAQQQQAQQQQLPAGGSGGSSSQQQQQQQQVPPPQRKVERPRGRWTVTAKVTGGGDPVDLVSFSLRAGPFSLFAPRVAPSAKARTRRARASPLRRPNTTLSRPLFLTSPIHLPTLLSQFCFSVHWPGSWVPTKGTPSLHLGFRTAAEAARWHAALQAELASLRRGGSGGSATAAAAAAGTADGSLPTYQSDPLAHPAAHQPHWHALPAAAAAVAPPTSRRRLLRRGGGGTSGEGGVQHASLDAWLNTVGPQGQAGGRRPGEWADDEEEEDDSDFGSSDEEDEAGSGGVGGVGSSEEDEEDRDRRSAVGALDDLDDDGVRWVPYRHTNGVAIYQNRAAPPLPPQQHHRHQQQQSAAATAATAGPSSSPSTAAPSAAFGGEYMASTIVRGGVDECLSVLLDPRTSGRTSLLGPAARAAVLREEGVGGATSAATAQQQQQHGRQVLRLTIEPGAGWARRLCAPREVVVERLLKRDGHGVAAVLFCSTDEFDADLREAAAERARRGPTPRERRRLRRLERREQAERAAAAGRAVGLLAPLVLLLLRLSWLRRRLFAALLALLAAPAAWWYRPVRATVRGGYTISPREGAPAATAGGAGGSGTTAGGEPQHHHHHHHHFFRGGRSSSTAATAALPSSSPIDPADGESLVTAVLKVDLGGICGARSRLFGWAEAFGAVDAYVERMLLGVILLKDEVEQRRFMVPPFAMLDEEEEEDEEEDEEDAAAARAEEEAEERQRRQRQRQRQRAATATGAAPATQAELEARCRRKARRRRRRAAEQAARKGGVAAAGPSLGLAAGAASLGAGGGAATAGAAASAALGVAAALGVEGEPPMGLMTCARFLRARGLAPPVAVLPEGDAAGEEEQQQGGEDDDDQGPSSSSTPPIAPLTDPYSHPSPHLSSLDHRFWSELHVPNAPAPFKLRGPTYFDDRAKTSPGLPRLSLVSVDLVATPQGPLTHIARYVPAARQTGAAWSFVVNLIIPGTPTLSLVAVFATERHPRELGPAPQGVWSGPQGEGWRSDRQGWSPASSAAAAASAQAHSTQPYARMAAADPSTSSPSSASWAPFDRALHRFYHGDDATRTAMLKLVPSLSGGSWVVRQSVGTVPVIVGTKLRAEYFRGPGDRYLEASVDVTSSAAAAYVTGMVRGATRSLAIDLGFVLEAHASHELPEALLGAFRLHHLDCNAAKELVIPADGKPVPMCRAVVGAPLPALLGGGGGGGAGVGGAAAVGAGAAAAGLAPPAAAASAAALLPPRPPASASATSGPISRAPSRSSTGGGAGLGMVSDLDEGLAAAPLPAAVPASPGGSGGVGGGALAGLLRRSNKDSAVAAEADDALELAPATAPAAPGSGPVSSRLRAPLMLMRTLSHSSGGGGGGGTAAAAAVATAAAGTTAAAAAAAPSSPASKHLASSSFPPTAAAVKQSAPVPIIASGQQGQQGQQQQQQQRTGGGVFGTPPRHGPLGAAPPPSSSYGGGTPTGSGLMRPVAAVGSVVAAVGSGVVRLLPFGSGGGVNGSSGGGGGGQQQGQHRRSISGGAGLPPAEAAAAAAPPSPANGKLGVPAEGRGGSGSAGKLSASAYISRAHAAWRVDQQQQQQQQQQRAGSGAGSGGGGGGGAASGSGSGGGGGGSAAAAAAATSSPASPTRRGQHRRGGSVGSVPPLLEGSGASSGSPRARATAAAATAAAAAQQQQQQPAAATTQGDRERPHRRHSSGVW